MIHYIDYWFKDDFTICWLTNWLTNWLNYGHTLVVVKSLSRLKTEMCYKKLDQIPIHSELEQTLCKMNCPKGSDSDRVSRAIVGTTPNAQANPRVLVFLKKINFSFFRAQKINFFKVWVAPQNFFWSPDLFWPLKLWFRGFILLAFVDISINFWSFLGQNWLWKSSQIKKK